MDINIHNVEELIFYNNKAQQLLPEFAHLFAQWKLAKRTPALRFLGKRAVLDFLGGIQSNHLGILSEYFSCEITLQKVDYSVVNNISCELGEVESVIGDVEGFTDFAVHRDGSHAYISFWR